MPHQQYMAAARGRGRGRGRGGEAATTLGGLRGAKTPPVSPREAAVAAAAETARVFASKLNQVRVGRMRRWRGIMRQLLLYNGAFLLNIPDKIYLQGLDLSLLGACAGMFAWKMFSGASTGPNNVVSLRTHITVEV